MIGISYIFEEGGEVGKSRIGIFVFEFLNLK